MNSAGALRRRVQLEDVKGRKALLGGNGSSSEEDDDREKKRKEQVWTQNVSKLLSQWTQWFSSVLVIAGAFHVVSNVLGRRGNGNRKQNLSSIQVLRLQKLQQRLAIPFDRSLPQH